MQYLDDQQPSEKDIVQPEDISNVPTEKCLENVGFELEKYVDVGSWPKSCLAIRGLVFKCTEEVFGSPHNGSFVCAPELCQQISTHSQFANILNSENYDRNR
ncbi:hypothetical protein TNCV_2420011 [Trichonephila clavipes]|nr:hypothetical protein TNCV_2420011 [Trichonephila clavipes]